MINNKDENLQHLYTSTTTTLPSIPSQEQQQPTTTSPRIPRHRLNRPSSLSFGSHHQSPPTPKKQYSSSNSSTQTTPTNNTSTTNTQPFTSVVRRLSAQLNPGNFTSHGLPKQHGSDTNLVLMDGNNITTPTPFTVTVMPPVHTAAPTIIHDPIARNNNFNHHNSIHHSSNPQQYKITHEPILLHPALWACIAYSLCSTSMVIFNKLLLSTYQFQFPMVLLLYQNCATVLSLWFARRTKLIDGFEPLEREKVLSWIPVNVFFVVMLLTSFKSVHMLSVPMVTIFVGYFILNIYIYIYIY